MTVNVPYFFDQTNGGETLVTVTNRVLRAQVKVCKVVEPGSLTPLGNNVWSYGGSSQGVGSALPQQTATNGTCTGLIVPASSGQSAGWQIITTTGSPASISMFEFTASGTPAWVISAASVDNLFPGAPAAVFGNTPPVVIWEPGAGVNVVTITNKYATG